MAQLQREVEELRSLSKASSQDYPDSRSRSYDDFRDQSPFDQNGRHTRSTEDSRRVSPFDQRSEPGRHISPEQGQQQSRQSGHISPQESRQLSSAEESSRQERRRMSPHEDARQISSQESRRMSPDDHQHILPQERSLISSQESRIMYPQDGSRRMSSHELQELQVSRNGRPMSAGNRTGSPYSQQRSEDTRHTPQYDQASHVDSRRISPDESRRDSPYDQQTTEEHRRVSPFDYQGDGVTRRSPTDGADPRISSYVQSRRSPDQSQIYPEHIESVESRSEVTSRYPEHTSGETSLEHRRSFVDDQEDSGHQSFEPPRGGSPPFGPEGQSLSPRQLRSFIGDQEQPMTAIRPQSAQSYRTSVTASPPTRDRPEDQMRRRPDSGGQRPSSQRGSPRDGDDQRRERRSPQERNGSASFTLEGDRLVEARPQQTAYDSSERYVGEDGQLYDKDGNIRPRYAHAESHMSPSASQVVSRSRSQVGREAPGQTGSQRAVYLDEENRVLARQAAMSDRPYVAPESEMAEGQDVFESRSYRDHDGQEDIPTDQGGSQGISSEADRYIQQLRRELLITKTALMQIQRGERLDTDIAGRDDIDIALPGEVSRPEQIRLDEQRGIDLSRGDMRHDLLPTTHRADVRYEAIPDEADINSLRRKLERTQEELELYRTSSNLSARDFVQASVK